MYNENTIVVELALMVFELLCPSISSPSEDWATLASCALVCGDWYALASPLLYRNIIIDMSSSWQRLRSLADSTSPFKRTVENLHIIFELQNLADESDTINFGTPSMNIMVFIHNCTWLRRILEQYTTVNALKLDITALSPFEDDDGLSFTEIDPSNALQSHSIRSIMSACYKYFLPAIRPLSTLMNTEGRRTPILLRIRHPITGLSLESSLDEQFLWQRLNGVLQLARHCRVTRMEVDIDAVCPFNWLWWFTRLEYLCIRQSHTSIHDYNSSDCVNIASSLSHFLPHVNVNSLSLCGIWSQVYPPTLAILSVDFCHWPYVDIFLFFRGLLSTTNLQILNIHFRCFDFYDRPFPTALVLATLAEEIEIELRRIRRIALFVDTDFHYPIQSDEQQNAVEILGDEALRREASIWKCCLGSMKSVKIVEIQEFNCSQREILEFVDNLEGLELLVSEEESIWAAEKATQMGVEWRLRE